MFIYCIGIPIYHIKNKKVILFGESNLFVGYNRPISLLLSLCWCDFSTCCWEGNPGLHYLTFSSFCVLVYGNTFYVGLDQLHFTACRLSKMQHHASWQKRKGGITSHLYWPPNKSLPVLIKDPVSLFSRVSMAWRHLMCLSLQSKHWGQQTNCSSIQAWKQRRYNLFSGGS